MSTEFVFLIQEGQASPNDPIFANLPLLPVVSPFSGRQCRQERETKVGSGQGIRGQPRLRDFGAVDSVVL